MLDHELLLIFLSAHAVCPYIVGVYYAEDTDDSLEWCDLFMLFCGVALGFHTIGLVSQSPRIVFEDQPGMYRIKALLLAGQVLGILMMYFFPDSQDSRSRRELKVMFGNRKTLLLGIGIFVVMYVWWWPGLMELCWWICMFTLIVLAGYFISKQIHIIKKTKKGGRKNHRKRVERVCKFRAVLAAIFLLLLMSCAWLRGWLLYQQEIF